MRTLRGSSLRIVTVLVASLLAVGGATLRAEEQPLPFYLADRGYGLPTSLFGTYISRHEFIVYPFYEYTKTSAFEYKPSELGYPGDTDYLGTTAEQEYLLYFGYGFTDRLAVELEVALYATTSFDKAPDDPSSVPAQIEESGLGDVDMQLRWRWAAETPHRPEMYSFFEVTPPLQKNDVLIGTQDWEASLGFGVVRGYRWGTITGRVAIAWDGADSKLDLGEYAVEYLKRVSPRWRFVATLEGETDEVSLIGEAQWFFSSFAFLKLNCGFGLTEKAPDIAPEVGVLFHF
jgi:hypothetical protein